MTIDELRVIELSHMVAAPVAGTILADLGADVVKVEPAEGDAARGFGAADDQRRSAMFRAVNRGKRSVVLDLTSSAGRDRVAALLDEADVLVTNYRPSALRKLGLDPDELRKRHPRLVTACIAAYPQPHDDLAGVDINALGLSGVMTASGWPGTPPVRPAAPVADMVTGILAATAVIDAVLRRDRSGEGAVLRLSLTETALYLNQTQLALAEETGRDPERLGNGSPFGLTGTFTSADGHVSLAAPSDRLFARLCVALDRPDLAERFPDHESRLAGRAALGDAIDAALSTRPTAHWVAELRAQGVPCAPVHTALGALADEHASGPGFLRAASDGPLDVALPWTFDGNRRRSSRPAPGLGEHTAELAP